MIHRINSVAPDLDDRVIKPNQARSATNLRFGASTDDSNLSGGVLVSGMERLDFNPNIALPDGSTTNSYVIGVKEDYENGFIYYAIFSYAIRGSGNHGILRINISDDSIEWVVRGSWLNFIKDSNVSMAIIDDKLYWTDGVNEPRMVNVNKAINTFNPTTPTSSNVYPIPNADNLWSFSQIKRSPQHPLTVVSTDSSYPPVGVNNAGYWYTTDNIAGYVNRNWVSETPYQFSYYYIYDNNEESRLAPWSECTFYIQNLLVSIPDAELYGYCNPADKTIIKNIVIVMRNGDEGTVFSVKKWDVNTFVLPPVETGVTAVIPNLAIPSVTSISKTPTPASVYDQRYDSVPLVSGTNEIANNILNHANVVLDYTDYGSVKINNIYPSKRSWNTFFAQSYPPKDISLFPFRTFRPGSTYTVGFQLIDEYGRTTPVLQSTSVTIPEPTVSAVKALTVENGRVTYAAAQTPTTFQDDIFNNQYSVYVELAGKMPNWAKYMRLCYTRNNTANFFYKTVCRIYYWYESGANERIYMRVPNYIASVLQSNNILKTVKKEGEPGTLYTFRGYAVELSGETPFIFDAAENQYLKIAREYYADNDILASTGTNPIAIEYKIKNQDGRLLLIEEDFSNIKFYTGYNLGTGGGTVNVLPLWYQVELFTKKEAAELIYYDTLIQFSKEEHEATSEVSSDFINGDCYISYFNKNFKGQSIASYQYQNYAQAEGYWYVSTNSVLDPGQTVNGFFYSMNITNINSEKWQSGLGLENIASNSTDITPDLNTSIVFSNQYLRGTQVNGLSKFNPLNIRQAPAENGTITSLVVTNATQQEPGVMLAIGSLGITSFYYGAIQLVNVDGSSNIATTDQHLASQRPLLGQFGTSQAGSISKTPLSTVYWWSDVVNDFIRYTNAGLERLGLTYSFSNKLRQKAAGKKVVTGYDQITDDAILIPENTNSFVFSERFKTFQGYREYYNSNGITPERIVGMSLKTYFFLDGYVYVSKPESQKNIFFNRTAQPQLTVVTNEYPSFVKQWNSIKVYGPKPVETNLTVGEAEGYYMETKIKPSWWIQRKGEYDAAVRRAIVGSGDGTSGKVMESRILYSTFVFDASEFDKLNFIEVKSNNAITQ